MKYIRYIRYSNWEEKPQVLEELISKYLQELQITGKSPRTIELYGLHLPNSHTFAKRMGVITAK